MSLDPTPIKRTECCDALRYAAAVLLDALASDDAALGPDGFDRRTAAAVQRMALLIRSP